VSRTAHAGFVLDALEQALHKLSNSAQYFPPNSAQNFPVYAVGFGCFRLCLNRKESFPVSRMSQ
jgi:hypothetical protein